MNSAGPFLQCFKRTVHVTERMRLLEIAERTDSQVLAAQLEGTIEGALEVALNIFGRKEVVEYLFRLTDEAVAPLLPQEEKQDGKTKGQ